MDDASDVIRDQTAKTFPYLFNCIAQWQDHIQNVEMDSSESYVEKSLDDVHYQTMIKGLAIHLDDSNNIIQVIFLNIHIFNHLIYNKIIIKKKKNKKKQKKTFILNQYYTYNIHINILLIECCM